MRTGTRTPARIVRNFVVWVREQFTGRDWSRDRAHVAVLVGWLAVAALLYIAIRALIVIPRWQVDELIGITISGDQVKAFELENEARKTLTQIIGGGFGLVLLFLTWRRVRANDRNVHVIEQGHITDRYTKAIEQLGKVEDGKPNIEVRLGGIYALERLAFDSPRDHWTIMEVLSAYVRRNAPWASEDQPDAAVSERRARVAAPRTDIQAILTVLGRRNRGKDLERRRLDLSRCDLGGADLNEAHLESADLIGAQLDCAMLSGAYLEGAMLWMAGLNGADIRDSHMKGADLRHARLGGANFLFADLTSAHLNGADLECADLSASIIEGADLTGAHLEGAYGLTIEQVKAARNWRQAHYDADFAAKLGLAGSQADSELTKTENAIANDDSELHESQPPQLNAERIEGH